MQIEAKPCSKTAKPKRILIIRLQALGDVVITLPYIQHLRNSLARDVQIDFLTREEVDSIPCNIVLFDKVYSIKGERNFKLQCIYALFLLPRLILNRYDAVIDLQNNLISRSIRKIIRPKAWSQFDKYSKNAAGERTRKTIENIGFGEVKINSNFKIKSTINTTKLLTENGWDGNSNLVILNPAGFFTTRNWPKENYIQWSKLWLKEFPNTQFLVIGIDRIKDKANYFKTELNDKLIDLVNKTSVIEAFSIIQKTKFVLSEDGGLMHMAWVSDIPTLALFGSTKSVWSKPLGNHSLLLSSKDLECGECMLEYCKYGTNHCLTRYTADFVFEQTLELLSKQIETKNHSE